MCAEMSFPIAYRPPAVTPGSNPMGGRVNPTASTTTNSPLTMTATSPTTGSCPPCKRPIATSGWTSSPSVGPGSAWAWGTTPGATTPCMKPSVNTGPEVKGGGPIPPKVNRGLSWEENHPLYPPSHAYLPPHPTPSGRPKVMWASYPRRGIPTGTTWGLKTPDIGIVATVSVLFDSHSGFSYHTKPRLPPAPPHALRSTQSDVGILPSSRNTNRNNVVAQDSRHRDSGYSVSFVWFPFFISDFSRSSAKILQCVYYFSIFLKLHNQKGCDTYLLDLTTWQILKYNNKYSNFFAFVLKPETQNNNFDNMQKIAKTTKQDVVNNRYYFIHCDVMT